MCDKICVFSIFCETYVTYPFLLIVSSCFHDSSATKLTIVADHPANSAYHEAAEKPPRWFVWASAPLSKSNAPKKIQ